MTRALIFACVAVACAAQAQQPVPAHAEGGPRDQESEIGQAVFDELKTKGEIIESSPLYDVPLPVIEPILRTA